MRKRYKSFSIDSDFRGKSELIDEILHYMHSAQPKSCVYLLITNNCGGAVNDAERLVRGICKYNHIKIHIIFRGYAISAAAYIYSYFVFYDARHEHVVIEAGTPLCIVFHKPRIFRGQVFSFANNIFENAKLTDKTDKYLLTISKEFDAIFNAMHSILLAEGELIAPHLKDVYNMNGDVSFTFPKEVHNEKAGRYRNYR
ncbi:hypothetical protein PGN69_04920 [Klebsiella aerogenes]|uniref:hypothetical protein n=1 Tax=Klebsiella aerogenes TaxID=548 RepID=UPI0028E060FB|nr:hypothetical protein [Klebsiella aerogenes]MDT8883205.1 hypothetical protein [Klebsiella aerogenes]